MPTTKLGKDTPIIETNCRPSEYQRPRLIAVSTPSGMPTEQRQDGRHQHQLHGRREALGDQRQVRPGRCGRKCRNRPGPRCRRNGHTGRRSRRSRPSFSRSSVALSACVVCSVAISSTGSPARRKIRKGQHGHGQHHQDRIAERLMMKTSMSDLSASRHPRQPPGVRSMTSKAGRDRHRGLGPSSAQPGSNRSNLQ